MKGYEEKLEEWVNKLGKVTMPDYYDVYQQSDGRLMLCHVSAEKAAHFARVSPNFVILSSKHKHKVATETGYYFERNRDDEEARPDSKGRYRLKSRYYDKIMAESEKSGRFWRRGWLTATGVNRVRDAGVTAPLEGYTLINIAKHFGVPVMELVEVMQDDS